MHISNRSRPLLGGGVEGSEVANQPSPLVILLRHYEDASRPFRNLLLRRRSQETEFFVLLDVVLLLLELFRRTLWQLLPYRLRTWKQSDVELVALNDTASSVIDAQAIAVLTG